MKQAQKDLCVAITHSLVFKNISTANAQYALVQSIIVTDCM